MLSEKKKKELVLKWVTKGMKQMQEELVIHRYLHVLSPKTKNRTIV
jgi:hypothetical protein